MNRCRYKSGGPDKHGISAFNHQAATFEEKHDRNKVWVGRIRLTYFLGVGLDLVALVCKRRLGAEYLSKILCTPGCLTKERTARLLGNDQRVPVKEVAPLKL